MTPDSPAPPFADFMDYESWWGSDPVASGDEFACESFGPSGHVSLTVQDGLVTVVSVDDVETSTSCPVADVTWWSLSRGPAALTVSLGRAEGAFDARFPVSMEECLRSGLTASFGAELRDVA